MPVEQDTVESDDSENERALGDQVTNIKDDGHVRKTKIVDLGAYEGEGRTTGDNLATTEMELDENFMSGSPRPHFPAGESEEDPDLFMTRQYVARGDEAVLQAKSKRKFISKQDSGLLADVQAINQQMLMPLESLAYASTVPGDKAESDGLAALGNQNSKSRQHVMNFETSKDIFESSGRVVNLQDTVKTPQQLEFLHSEKTASTLNATTLTKDKIAEEQKKQFCSLFVIFGLDASKFVLEDCKESYTILGSYPDLQQHPEVADEHKFVQDLRMICFPEVHLRPERFMLSKEDPLCRCNFFHFIATNDFGNKKYLTSVHFKEILLSEKGAFVIDKSICVASSLPIFSLQKQVLNLVFHRVILKNNNVSIKAFKEAQRQYEGFLDEYMQPPPHDFPNFVYKFMMDQIMCAQNRKDRDRSSPRRSKSPMHPAGNLPLVDFMPMMELYITIFCKHLYFDPKVDRDIHIELTETLQTSSTQSSQQLQYNTNQSMFGQGLGNYSSTGAIAPPQEGMSKNTKHVPLLKFRNLKPSGFQLENFSFDLLLQKLKPDKLVYLVTALLLERKIVLIKDEIGDIALIMQGLLTLLNPFQWCFTIITYLNRDLVDMLDAPFPFVIGVSTSTWEDICTLKDYPEDIYIFDLESQERRFISKVEIPELPYPYGDDLLNGLKDVMDKKDRRLEALKAEMKQNRSTRLNKQNLDQFFDEQYWADAELSVKQLFFNFLLMTVNNYKQFYVIADEAEIDKTGPLAGLKASEDVFNFQGYLEWQEERAAQRGTTNLFIREFIKTQTFHEFIEQNYEGTQEEAQKAVFFESCSELLTENKDNLKKLKAAQQEMIDQAKHNLATPVRFKFSHIYSMYVAGLRKREKLIRKSLEEIEGKVEERKQRSFAELSEADQLDEIIMKYIFMRPAKENSFSQFSLIQDVNLEMVLENIPSIPYDKVEHYWQKFYKAKQPLERAASARMDTLPVKPQIQDQSNDQAENVRIQNLPLEMLVRNPGANLAKRSRRDKKSKEEYDDFIQGGSQAQINEHEAFPQASTKAKIPLSKQRLSETNIIHDEPASCPYLQESIRDYLKSKKETNQRPQTNRQSQSQVKFANFSTQKALNQTRTAYKIRQLQEKPSQMTSVKKQKQDVYRAEGFQQIIQGASHTYLPTKSPKISGLDPLLKVKSTGHSIGRVAGKQSAISSTRNVVKKDNFQSASGPINFNNSQRNKSHSTAILKREFHPKPQLPLTTKKRQNFQDKVKVARQRGSIQYIPEKAPSPQQEPSSDPQEILTTEEVTTVQEDTHSSFIQLHLSTTERSEMERQSVIKTGLTTRMLNEEEGISLRQKGSYDNIITQQSWESEVRPNILSERQTRLLQNRLVEQSRELESAQVGLFQDYQRGERLTAKVLSNQSETHPTHRDSLRALSDSSSTRVDNIGTSKQGSQPAKYSLQFLKSKKLLKNEEFISIDTIEACGVTVPVYTEKKARVQVPPSSNKVPRGLNTIKYEVDSSSGSFIDIVKQEYEKIAGETERQSFKKPSFAIEQPALALKLPAASPVYASPVRDENIVDEHQFSMTENYTSNVNELIEDEAHMAQKTAYQLNLISKFKQLNSEEIKMQPREQMMPSQSISSMQKQTSSASNLWSSSSNNALRSESGLSSIHAMKQGSLVSSESQYGSLAGMMQSVNSTEMQASRKKPAMPLSMLLSRTDSLSKKRQSNSKTRSITEKQISFQAATRMPSHSMVGLGLLDQTPGSRQPERSNLNLLAQEPVGEEDDDEGWFTAVESRQLASKIDHRSKGGFKMSKKLEELYAYGDNNENSMEQAPLRANSSREELNPVVLKKSSEPLKMKVYSDSPQNQTLRVHEGADFRIAEPNDGQAFTQTKQRYQAYFS